MHKEPDLYADKWQREVKISRIVYCFLCTKRRDASHCSLKTIFMNATWECQCIFSYIGALK